MGLDNQIIRREFQHSFKDASRDAILPFRGLKWFGRARKKDPEVSEFQPRPGSLASVFGTVGLGSVQANIHEATPGPALGAPITVLNVATIATKKISKCTTPVWIQRVRRHGREEATAAGKDFFDRRGRCANAFLSGRIGFRVYCIHNL